MSTKLLHTQMAYKTKQLHFVLFPFLAQGHMIPMVDIGKLLAQHGHVVTILTTPINANRYEPNVARARNFGLQIQLMQLPFRCEEVGLPKDYENVDMLSVMLQTVSFLDACEFLREPVEKLLEKIEPRPSCVISDMCFPYMSDVASKYEIPRIFFNGFSCFCLLCLHKVNDPRILDTVSSDSEPFVVSELPGSDRIEVTKKELPKIMIKNHSKLSDRILESEKKSFGTIINSFEELEVQYVKEYKTVKHGKAWCVGPVSLCNKDDLDKANRGKRTEFGESECLKWLNSQQPESVIYVCLGTICNLIITSTQLMEIGLGLEASNRPFIWVIKNGEILKEMNKLLQENGFEERTKQRGIVVRGWAPQVTILSHPAIGVFLTHCGWNSTLEAITSGIPMVTLPLLGDQFCNQKFVVEVLKIGVRIGTDILEESSEKEHKHVLQVNCEDVKRAIENLMDESEESEKIRKRAKELSKIANNALVDEGSSYRNIKLFIRDIMQFHLSKQENIAQQIHERY